MAIIGTLNRAVRYFTGVAEQYNKNGIFPLTLLLDADGKVLKSWQGKPDDSVEKWVQEIQGIYDANK